MTSPQTSTSTLVGVGAPGIVARAGLRRIIAQAGLDFVDDGRAADIVVYDDVHFDLSARGAPVQIAIQADRIVIAVAAMPNEVLWSDVRKLLRCLDGPAGGRGR